MKDLGSLLGRITRSLGKSTLLKEGIASVINEKTGSKLIPEDVLYKEGVVEVKASPALKSEIRMKEESIKSGIRQATGSVVTRFLFK